MIRCVTFGNCAAACVASCGEVTESRSPDSTSVGTFGKLRLRRQRIALRIRGQRLRPVETSRERREVRVATASASSIVNGANRSGRFWRASSMPRAYCRRRLAGESSRS